MPSPCASSSPLSRERASATFRPSSSAGAWPSSSSTTSSRPAPCARWVLQQGASPAGLSLTLPHTPAARGRLMRTREHPGLHPSLCSPPGLPLHQGHLLPGGGAGAARHLDHPLCLRPRREYPGTAGPVLLLLLCCSLPWGWGGVVGTSPLPHARGTNQAVPSLRWSPRGLGWQPCGDTVPFCQGWQCPWPWCLAVPVSPVVKLLLLPIVKTHFTQQLKIAGS